MTRLVAQAGPETFDFDQQVRAFSVDVIDTIAFAPAYLTVALDGTSPTAAYKLPGTATIQFLGVLDLDGFQSLSLSTAFAKVPEPATLALLGAALLGLAARRRTRQP